MSLDRSSHLAWRRRLQETLTLCGLIAALLFVLLTTFGVVAA